MELRYAALSLSLLAMFAHGETITDACFNCPPLTTIADASSFNDDAYYQDAISAINNNLSSAMIKEKISFVISQNHKQLSYSEVWTALTETDEDPNNANNILLLYKGVSLAKFANGSGTQSSDPDNWNREHVWAKSHGFSSSSYEAYTDIHHLRPADISINSSRGNLDFDNSDAPLAEAPSNRLDGDSFEPRDAVKGDVARMLFYMDTRYQGLDVTPDLTLVNHITSTGEAKLGMLCRLIEWHKNDPVDSLEINRNNRIYEFQGNRNPFIDHPEWVDMLYSADTCADSGTGEPDPEPEPDPDTGNDGDTPATTGSLFISEYVEGSSYNKAIELFNPSGTAIDLAAENYVLTRYNNGSTSGSDIVLQGTIEANATFVIAEPRSAQDILAIANQTSGSLSHNGDDAYVLFKDGVAVDSFGRVGEDPGSQWGDGLYKTKDNSLRRNASVTQGDPVFDDSFDPSIEWTGSSNNDFSDLGHHVMNAPEIFISEYIEGSSYNKAIELYNPSNSPVVLADHNYQLTLYSNGSLNGTSIALSGVVPSKGVFVIANPSANSDILSVTDQLSSDIRHNGDDAYVLSKDGVAIDAFGRVGEDPGSQWGEGSSKTKDNTLVRKASVSVGDSIVDDLFDPSIEWDGLGNNFAENLGMHLVDGEQPTVSAIGECFADAIAIHEVQGSGMSSPLLDSEVIVEGVVTSVNENLSGFFLQEEDVDQDADAATSEAVFIATLNDSYPNVGDVVRVIGMVKENYGKTQISLTETPLVCGTDSVSSTLLVLPFASDTSAESLEGMYISVSQPLTVTDNYNLGRYGEVTLSQGRLYVPTNLYAPGSEQVTNLAAQNARNKIILDDGINGQNPENIIYPNGGLSINNTLRLGDQVNNLSGVLDYSYGNYRILPSEQPSFIQENVREDAPVISDSGNLRVANANLLNFFNGDGLGGGFPTPRGADNEQEFVRQKDKIVNALLAMNADIIGLQEVENDGFGEHSALQTLVDALNAKASANVHYRFVDPSVEQLGGDKIKVALIYNDKTVSEFGTAAYLLDFPFEYHNRPPLTQTFRSYETGERLTVSVNHFRSKGCSSTGGVDNEDKKDGQGCYNLRRVQAAQTLLAWLATNPTGVEDDDVLIIGDLNSYNKEDPITTLLNGGYSDLAQDKFGANAYSYSIFGEIGALDHAMASQSLKEKIVDITEWHINADEPRIFDYNTEFKSAEQVSSLYSDQAFRVSDHDPVVIEIEGVTPLISVNETHEGLGTNARWTTFEFEVPETSVSFNAKTFGGDGNVDLYVSRDKKPNTQKFLCAPKLEGNEEVCQFDFPEAGKWYIRLRGERHYNDVTLVLEALYPEPINH